MEVKIYPRATLEVSDGLYILAAKSVGRINQLKIQTFLNYFSIKDFQLFWPNFERNFVDHMREGEWEEKQRGEGK